MERYLVPAELTVGGMGKISKATFGHKGEHFQLDEGSRIAEA
jgi:hypothetical protein